MDRESTNAINKMIQLETRQEERHTENQKSLEVLFTKLQKIDTLPCDVHVEKMKWFQKSLYALWCAFGGLVVWIAYTQVV